MTLRDQKLPLNQVSQLRSVFAQTIQVIVIEQKRTSRCGPNQPTANRFTWFDYLPGQSMKDPALDHTRKQTILDETNVGVEPVGKHESTCSGNPFHFQVCGVGSASYESQTLVQLKCRR